jgi:hypothetical protein
MTEQKEKFSSNIKEWNILDKKIKVLQENLNTLKNQKTIIKENIINYVENNNLNNAVIKVDNNQLRFIKYKQVQPLTFKFLKNCLDDCIEDSSQVDLLIEYIKNQRDIIEYLDIKSYK